MSTPTVLPWHKEVQEIAAACKGHTPAPWGYDLNHTVGRHEDGEWEESVCQLPVGTHKRRPTAQEKSDMALIARAPRMLQLLTELARHDPHGAQHAETVRLLEEALPYICAIDIAKQIRAHLAALKQQ